MRHCVSVQPTPLTVLELSNTLINIWEEILQHNIHHLIRSIVRDGYKHVGPYELPSTCDDISTKWTGLPNLFFFSHWFSKYLWIQTSVGFHFHQMMFSLLTHHPVHISIQHRPTSFSHWSVPLSFLSTVPSSLPGGKLQLRLGSYKHTSTVKI